MADDKEALARRAVKCKGWRWMAGMKLAGRDDCYRLTYVRREPVREGEPDPFPVLESGGPENFPGWGWPKPGSGWLPDLDDHATLGCIEHGMLPAAWPDGYRFTVSTDSTGACVTVCEERGEFVRGFIRDTLGEALVACLELAAERRRP